jgi:peptidoglycan hydrolase-like protein with peptidoglycan-binding domain
MKDHFTFENESHEFWPELNEQWEEERSRPFATRGGAMRSGPARGGARSQTLRSGRTGGPAGAQRPRPSRPKPKPRPKPRPRPGGQRGGGAWPAVLIGGEPSAPPEGRVECGSENVRWVQSTLNRVMGLNLPVSGVADVQTRSAVRSFQRQRGLPDDGIIGPPTERALMDAGSAPAPPGGDAPAPTGNGAPPPASDDAPATDQEFAFEQFEAFDTGLAQEFETGVNRNSPSYIRWVQQSLNRVMGLRLSVDGVLGAQTRSAIRNFQTRAGLQADGNPGPKTEAALIARGAGRPAAAKPGGVIEIPPVVICAGKPFDTLDQFSTDSFALRKDRTKDHFAQVDAIAREIVARWLKSKPVLSVCLVGHTDDVGTRAYNFGLGERRARAVKNALCAALVKESNKAGRGDIPGKMTFAVTSSGEDDPATRSRTPVARATNRRVQVFLLADKVPGETCDSPRPAPDFDLETCFNECNKEFERCRQTSSLTDCARKRGQCRRNCRGIPV